MQEAFEKGLIIDKKKKKLIRSDNDKFLIDFEEILIENIGTELIDYND